MARRGFTNVLLNPKFAIRPYGPGPFTATGYFAACWRQVRTGGAGIGSVGFGTISADTAVAKEFRGKPCLEITVDPSFNPASHSLVIRQRVEDFDQHSRGVVRMMPVVFATADADWDQGFSTGSDDPKTRLTGKGLTTKVEVPLFDDLPDHSTTYFDAEIFRAVEAGTFQIPFPQVDVYPSTVDRWEGMEIGREPPFDEWLCARRVRELGPDRAEAISATQIEVWVPLRPNMRAVPSVIGISTAPTFKVGASSFVASGATYTISDATTKLARVVISGFSGLATGARGALTTEGAAVLEAELG